jgi:alanine racemase
LGRPPTLTHAGNSAGIWWLRGQLDLVRPGVFLYGGHVGGHAPAPQPVIAVRARVVSTRRLRAGDSVSYGGTWRAERSTHVATLGIGYADGMPRSAQGRARVLLGGSLCPVVGRVTMDMVMVETEGAVPGDVATLIGSDGESAIALDEFAGWAGTVSYEILAGLGPRLPRVYE